MKKRWLSIVLLLALILSMLPLPAQAATPEKVYNYLVSYAKKGTLNKGNYERVGNRNGLPFTTVYYPKNDMVAIQISLSSIYSIGNSAASLRSGHLISDIAFKKSMTTPYEGRFVYTVLGSNNNATLAYCDIYPEDYSAGDAVSLSSISGNEISYSQAKDLMSTLMAKELDYLDYILRLGGYSLRDLGFTHYNDPYHDDPPIENCDHKYDSGKVSTEPTCLLSGIKVFTCTICGNKRYEKIPALGHQYTLRKVISEGSAGEHGSAQYECSRCGNITVDEYCTRFIFTDVPAKGNWAHNGIDWAYFNGVTNGTSGNTFSPNAGCTRAQVVTFLWRAAGSPATTSSYNPFRDVKSSGFYYNAMLWAVEKGITKGTDSTHFSPDKTCSRGEIVTFLWRSVGQPGPKTTSCSFRDVVRNAFYYDAMLWAVENEVTNGTSSTTFSPNDTCTRAQVVTFLFRTKKMEPKKIDLAELEAAIRECEALDESDYTSDSWQAMQEALTAAKTILNDKNGTQEAVNEAKSVLRDAVSRLEPKPINRDGLAAAIRECENLDKSDYIPSEWKAIQEALSAAKKTYDNVVSTQEEIDTAENDLRDAVSKLKPINRNGLAAAINKCKDLDKANYVPTGWQAMQQALSAAEKIYKNDESTQEEIDQAEKNLRFAIAKLEELDNREHRDWNGNLIWTYNSETEELRIIKMKSKPSDARYPWVSLNIRTLIIDNDVTSIDESAFKNNTHLESVTILDGTTSIGDYAFSDCTNLKSVTIPDSVTVIGPRAFEDCTSLTSVTIPNNLPVISYNMFSGCTSLTSVTIPDSVTIIGEYVFSGCSSLTNVVIPDSLTEIDSHAFDGCTSLTSVTIPDSVTIIGEYVFSGCSSLTSVTIPASVTYISDRAFSDCTSLTSVTIPDSVTVIGPRAFEDCTSLTSVTIPDSLTSIGWSAFLGCSSLKSVTIPDSVTNIGHNAFNGCSSLTSVTIPNGMGKIEYYAFSNCSCLTSVTIPASVTRIEGYAFRGCSSLIEINVAPDNPNYISVDGILFTKDSTNLLQYPAGNPNTSYTIPASVTKIEKYAFAGCSSLTSVTIPGSVTIIDEGTFAGCSSLTNVTILKGVTRIGVTAFGACSSLTSVTIPASVTGIGERAFYGCSSLTSVTIPASVTGIGERAFYDCSSLTSVTIPDGVTRIEANTFYGCSSLTNVTIPDSVTSIKQYAFYGCSSLTSVSIPASVKAIGGCAFAMCSSLTSVTIPDGVEGIYVEAFQYCTSLTSVSIPASVTYIVNPFFGCSNLKDVYYGGSEAEWNKLYGKPVAGASMHYAK